MDIYELENSSGVVVSVGGQLPQNVALRLQETGKANVLGTDPSKHHSAHFTVLHPSHFGILHNASLWDPEQVINMEQGTLTELRIVRNSLQSWIALVSTSLRGES